MSQPTADDLRRAPLLASLDDNARERLASSFEITKYPNGERIIVEGASGHDLYIVDRGRAIATQRELGLVGMIGPGDFFGEIAPLASRERTATVTASTPMVVWVLDERATQRLRIDHPEVADALNTAMQDHLAAD